MFSGFEYSYTIWGLLKNRFSGDFTSDMCFGLNIQGFRLFFYY